MIDSELGEGLKMFGAVSIEGPRGVGKTASASRFAKSILPMQDSDRGKDNRGLAGINPSMLLEGSTPRLIDEWRVVPELWDAFSTATDDWAGPGQFILTASVVPDGSGIRRDGTDRIRGLRMGTLNLFESGDSTGAVSLKGLFRGDSDVQGVTETTIEDIARLIVRGGWPEAVGGSGAAAGRFMKRYCDAIVDAGISEASGIARDGDKVRAVMGSLSALVSQPLSKARILHGMPTGRPLSRNTLDTYLEALRDIFVLQELEAWSPNLRSKTPVRTAATVHFCDPAIATHFMSASPGDLLRDVRTFGLLFESLVIRDLRTYVQFMGGDVFHYRDKTGLEADAVIHLHDGRWAAIEVKLGQGHIDEGAGNLLKLRDRIDSRTMGEPTFMAVITGTRYAYTREDGVHVIPIALLGP